MREGMPTPELRHTCECGEALLERLGERLEHIADQINERYAGMLCGGTRTPHLVGTDCQLNMRSFMRTKYGGPYEKGDASSGGIVSDEQQVRRREIYFSGAMESATQKRFGTSDIDALIAAWKREQKGKDGTIAEQVMLHLFHKVFHEDFLVVRASAYDDYENGVDMMIVDTRTGEVLCAFDEVVGVLDDARYQHKLERRKAQLQRRGGAELKYGLTVRPNDSGESKLVRTPISGVPGYTVRLAREELHDFLSACDLDTDTLTPAEMEMMQRLLADLAEQETAREETADFVLTSRIAPLVAAFRKRTDTGT